MRMTREQATLRSSFFYPAFTRRYWCAVEHVWREEACSKNELAFVDLVGAACARAEEEFGRVEENGDAEAVPAEPRVDEPIAD